MYSEQDIKELGRKLASDELKRIQYYYRMGYTESEIKVMLEKDEPIIEHDQRPAERVGNYHAQIQAQYYGWGATLYRNLWRH